ncbi:MAG TPA: Wzz/FepE/Etk N-terminal domain-containing protein [Candidatus Limnocylindria bacterium]|nr:Wzz/FepE/Etk N-terminal domain-containing protein [Candidatus Limnocylindria bacterium]
MNSALDFPGALRRWWWIVVFLVAAALALAALVTARQQPVFESSAMMVVGPSSETSDPAEVVRSLDTLERRTVVATFARIPSTLEMREAVAGALAVNPRQVRPYRISGSVVPSTNIIRIEVEGPDPVMAAQVANVAADLTARQARSLYRVYSMRMLSRATPRRQATYPDPQRNYVVGGAVGLFLGIAAALVLDRRRRPHAEPDEGR